MKRWVHPNPEVRMEDHLPAPLLTIEEQLRADAELAAYLRGLKERDARVERERVPTAPEGVQTMAELVWGPR